MLYPSFIKTIDIDDCGNHSCLNGATCKDLIHSYECDCVQGYNGTFCGAGNIYIILYYIYNLIIIVNRLIKWFNLNILQISMNA